MKRYSPKLTCRAKKNKKLSSQDKDQLFDHRSFEDREWYETWVAGGELEVTDQDRLLISLLTPERLLEMTQMFILFDNKVGKVVARYQQVFGVKRLVERIKMRRPDGSRKGGITWHTTSSGKSFTMVFLSQSVGFTERPGHVSDHSGNRSERSGNSAQ